MPDRRTATPTRKLLLGLLAIVAVASACGGQSDDSMSDGGYRTGDPVEAASAVDGGPDGNLAFGSEDATEPGGESNEGETTGDGATDNSSADNRRADNRRADDVTDDGVLEAAIIILTDGDLEGALAAGRITEAEVGAAIDALDGGTIITYLD